MRHYRDLPGLIVTPGGLTEALGFPAWAWSEMVFEGPGPCVLARGNVMTAGFGNAGAACRVYIHTDGVCVTPALDIRQDREMADAVFAMLKGERPYEDAWNLATRIEKEGI